MFCKCFAVKRHLFKFFYIVRSYFYSLVESISGNTIVPVICIRVYRECFLMRAKDNDEDPLWRRFYRIQMSSYLCCKKNLEVSAPEGDMVHDLIRGVWEDDVKDYMENSKFGPVSNVEQWFRTIRIDFPVDPFDPCCSFFRPRLQLVCQNGTEKQGKAGTV